MCLVVVDSSAVMDVGHAGRVGNLGKPGQFYSLAEGSVVNLYWSMLEAF